MRRENGLQRAGPPRGAPRASPCPAQTLRRGAGWSTELFSSSWPFPQGCGKLGGWQGWQWPWRVFGNVWKCPPEPEVPFGRQGWISWEVLAGASTAGKRLEGKLRQHCFRSMRSPIPFPSFPGSFWLPGPSAQPWPSVLSLVAGPAALSGIFSSKPGNFASLNVFLSFAGVYSSLTQQGWIK